MKEDVQQPSFRELKEDSDYLIYSDGRLYSKKCNRFLQGKIDNVGYRVYALAIKDEMAQGVKKSRILYAHRLVAQYFIPNPSNLPYVHHKDENKLNNNVDNLQWISAKDNAQEHLKKCGRQEYKPARYNVQDLENEEWKVIPINERYSVSNMGKVKNNKTNRLLHLDENQKYVRISMSPEKNKHYYVHRLVYCTFNNDFDLDGFQIDHIDGNPKNNKLSNLQKVTPSENSRKQKRYSKEGSTTIPQGSRVK